MRVTCWLGLLAGSLVILSGCGDSPQKAPKIGFGGLGIATQTTKNSNPPTVTPEDIKSARELLDKVIQAHGGLDSLKKFKNFQVEAEGWSDMAGKKINCARTSVYSYPDRVRHRWVMETKPDPLTVVAALNGSTGWLKEGKMAPMPFSADFLTQLQLENQLDWYPFLFITEEPNIRITICSVPDLNGKKMLGLAIAQTGRPEIQLQIDPESYLLRAVNVEMLVAFVPTQYQIIYNDYKSIVGANLPHLIQGLHNKQAKFELRVKALRPVQEVESDLFDSAKN